MLDSSKPTLGLISAEPEPIRLDWSATALVIIDMQRDFMEPGGFGETLGNDVSQLARAVKPIGAVLKAARATGMLVIHTREAEEDTAQILEEAVKEGGVTGVLHCFTGSAKLARKGLDLGFYVSISGIVTFKNAADLQATARWLPAPAG